MDSKDEINKLYAQAILLARQNNQTVGEKNDYYITIWQLEYLIKSFK